MNAYKCINFSVQTDNKGLNVDEFNKVISIVNDDNLLNDKLNNYIYYNNKISKINDKIMETLLIDTNIDKNRINIEQDGGSKEDEEAQKETEIFKSLLKDEAKIESDLLLLPLNPIDSIVDMFRPYLKTTEYWSDYFTFSKSEELLNHIKSIVRDDKYNFFNISYFKEINPDNFEYASDLLKPIERLEPDKQVNKPVQPIEPIKPDKPVKPDEPVEPKNPIEPKVKDTKKYLKDKKQYDADKKRYDEDKKRYDEDKKRYDEDKIKYPGDKVTYKKNRKDYNTLKEKYNEDKKQYDINNKEYEEYISSVKKYEKYKKDIKQYDADITHNNNIIKEREKFLDILKRLISLYDEKGVDMYIPFYPDGSLIYGKVIFDGTDFYAYYKKHTDTIKEVDETGNPVMIEKMVRKVKTLVQKETSVFEFTKFDRALTLDELFGIFMDPIEAIQYILKTRLGTMEGSSRVENKVAAEKQQAEKSSLRFLTDKAGDLPMCCNSGCYRIPVNQVKHEAYPGFVSIRQECAACTKMRKGFDILTIYNGFRIHIIFSKIIFIKCRPVVLKRNYCQNAGIKQRNDLFEKIIGDPNEEPEAEELIKKFNKKLEIKKSMTAKPMPTLSGGLQQCPLNLIPPHFNGDYPPNQEYLDGLSKVYVNLVSNCYDQDHISGGHADNRAQNIWTFY
jgi:hypothetical protein